MAELGEADEAELQRLVASEQQKAQFTAQVRGWEPTLIGGGTEKGSTDSGHRGTPYTVGAARLPGAGCQLRFGSHKRETAALPSLAGRRGDAGSPMSLRPARAQV
jgi:hypothetical protein